LVRAALPLTLHFGGKSFATTTLPPQPVVAGKDNIFTTFSTVHVHDIETFTAFGTAIVTQNSVEWRLVGKAAVTSTVAGIQQTISGLDFDKTITTVGGGGLRTMVVRQFSLAGSTADQVMAQLHTSIYSPSTVSILGLGAACVNVTYNGTQISISRASSVSLVQGWTDLTFDGPLDPKSLTARDDLFDKYLSGASTGVTAAAFACEGTSSLFRGVVPALKLHVELPGSPYQLIEGMHVNGLEMVPGSESRVGIKLNATVTLNDPLGVGGGLVVQSVGMQGNLFGDGVDVGTLVIPTTPVAPEEQERAISRPAVSQQDARWPAALVQALAASGIPPPPPPLPPAPPAQLNVSIRVEGQLELSGPGLNDTAPEFATFVDRFLLNDSVTMEVASSSPTALETTIHCGLGEVTIHVPLHIPPATVPGAAGIPDVEVESFDIIGQASTGTGLEVRLVTSMVNPSNAVVPMGGKVVFGVFGGEQDVRLGSVAAYNASLRPGRNVLEMTGTIDPPAAGLPFVGQIFTNYLAGVKTKTITRGESVEPAPGRLAPSWLQKAIQHVSLDSYLPGLQGVSLFTDMNVNSMLLDFGPDNAVTLTGQLTGIVHVPFTNVQLDILSVSAEFSLEDTDGNVMAVIQLVNAPANYTPFSGPGQAPAGVGGEPAATGRLLVNVVDPAPLRVVDETSLSRFLATALLNETVTNTLSILASQQVMLSFGEITIANVSARETVTLPALDGLRTPPAQVVGTKLMSATEEQLTFDATLNVSSTSVLGGDFGPSTLDMYFEDELIGSAAVQHFSVKAGVNLLRSQTFFQPANTTAAGAAGRRFLSAFLMGQTSRVQLRGTPTSTPYPLLQPGVSQLVLDTNVPGAAHHLIQNATMNISTLTLADMSGHIGLVNPTALSTTIVRSDLHVTVCTKENATTLDCDEFGPELAVFTPEDLTKDPIFVPASSSIITKDRVFRLSGDVGATLDVLIDLVLDGGIVNTQVNGTESVVIGGVFATEVDYIQPHVLMRVHF
jgi:hypothetical protein